MQAKIKRYAMRWTGALLCALMLAGTLFSTVLAASVTTVSATLSPDITVQVDGATRTFFNVNGVQVHPVLYNGTTYLPVRAIGELMGKTVSWNGTTRTVTLTASGSGGLVTDADTFNPATPTQPGNTQSGSYIGVERAKSIALAHAGLTSNQVTFVKSKLEFDDGRWEYEIEFYTGNYGNYKEYDYDIDAYTGNILSFDYDVESWAPPVQDTSGTGTQISLERAKSIALNHVGLSASQVRFVKARLDRDDGRWEYEIEFISGSWEYEFEIDAYSGAILSYERDSIYD